MKAKGFFQKAKWYLSDETIKYYWNGLKDLQEMKNCQGKPVYQGALFDEAVQKAMRYIDRYETGWKDQLPEWEQAVSKAVEILREQKERTDAINNGPMNAELFEKLQKASALSEEQKNDLEKAGMSGMDFYTAELVRAYLKAICTGSANPEQQTNEQLESLEQTIDEVKDLCGNLAEKIEQQKKQLPIPEYKYKTEEQAIPEQIQEFFKPMVDRKEIQLSAEQEQPEVNAEELKEIPEIVRKNLKPLIDNEMIVEETGKGFFVICKNEQNPKGSALGLLKWFVRKYSTVTEINFYSEISTYCRTYDAKSDTYEPISPGSLKSSKQNALDKI